MAKSIDVIHNGKVVTMELIPSYDWVRDLRYIAAYIAVKADYRRYDVGKFQTIDAAKRKCRAFMNRVL